MTIRFEALNCKIAQWSPAGTTVLLLSETNREGFETGKGSQQPPLLVEDMNVFSHHFSH